MANNATAPPAWCDPRVIIMRHSQSYIWRRNDLDSHASVSDSEATRSDSARRSRARKGERPADTSTKGSLACRLVQLTRKRCNRPSAPMKWTRSSPRLTRVSSASKRRPLRGWKGWVTANVLVESSSRGAIVCVVRRVARDHRLAGQALERLKERDMAVVGAVVAVAPVRPARRLHAGRIAADRFRALEPEPGQEPVAAAVDQFHRGSRTRTRQAHAGPGRSRSRAAPAPCASSAPRPQDASRHADPQRPDILPIITLPN